LAWLAALLLRLDLSDLADWPAAAVVVGAVGAVVVEAVVDAGDGAVGAGGARAPFGDGCLSSLRMWFVSTTAITPK